MPQLLIRVQNKIAKPLNDFIVCNNSDYTVKFVFDKEWEDKPIKTARFIWNNQYQDVVFEGDICKMPIIENATTLGIGVFAGSLKTTTPAIITCAKSVLCGLGRPSDPPEDVYNQILRLLNEDLTNLRTEVDNIVISATGDGNAAAEVGQARVNANGTAYPTLKHRIDADYTALNNKVDNKISETKNDLQNQIANTNNEVNNKISETKNNLENQIANTNNEVSKVKSDLDNSHNEIVQARVDVDGTEHSTLKTRLDADFNDLNNTINGVDKDLTQFKNGEIIKLYDNLSELTQNASSGAANAYLYAIPFKSGYIKDIKLNSSASGTIKLYIYKLVDGTYTPMEMYFVNAISGENIVSIEKIIDYEFYIAFSSYNGAKVIYTDAQSVDNNTTWIDAGEPTTNSPANAYKFGIEINYGPISKIYESIGNSTYKHSLFLNVPDHALSSKGNTGAANAYFVNDKFNKGFIKRIYVKGLDAGETRVILYRVSGDSYVPFKTYTKNIVSGENYIDVYEWIYCDFYVAISGKFVFVDKYIGANNALWVELGKSIPITTEPKGKYYFGVYFEYETNPTVEKYKNRIYNLHDAFMAWNDGKKFPVCFAGDSTTDGYQTTGYTKNIIGTDHVLPNIYTKLFEDYLKSEFTSNKNLRIYNAGFSGQTAAWFDNNFYDEIINNPYYSDTLMLGISFGINDRPKTSTEYSAVMARFENIIKKCYDNGIQPFLLTCQAGVEFSSRDTVKRYEYITNSYANKIKYELADKYNLEIIDVSKYTHNFITNSNYSGTQIIADHCHFNDTGHKYEAGMFFAHFIPRTIWVDKATKIGFDSYGIKTNLTSDANSASPIKTINTVTAGFKMKASEENSTNKVIMDFWVFVDADRPLNLKSYCGAANSQYVVVDGVNHTISNTEQTIAELDLGLHRVTVHSGTGNINFLGFKLV